MRIRSFARSMRQTSPSPWSTRLAWAVIGLSVLFFGTIFVRNVRRYDSLTVWRQSLEEATRRPAWPEWAPVWPPLPSPQRRGHQLPGDLHGPYAYAARHQDLLKNIPCYCGCVREGHRSNLNCFVTEFRPGGTPVWTDHSFSCAMCVHIAREVMLMSTQGMSVQQIRQEIDDRYRVFGEPTKTPGAGTRSGQTVTSSIKCTCHETRGLSHTS